MSRDRDRILEQALKHELRATGTPPAGGCLDAETLGAWTGGGLEPAAMATVEAHVSSCARCQALVGAMARSTLGTPRTGTHPWHLIFVVAGTDCGRGRGHDVVDGCSGGTEACDFATATRSRDHPADSRRRGGASASDTAEGRSHREAHRSIGATE